MPATQWRFTTSTFKGGRCEAANGDGILKSRCTFAGYLRTLRVCGGTALNAPRWRCTTRQSIYDVLEMTLWKPALLCAVQARAKAPDALQWAFVRSSRQRARRFRRRGAARQAGDRALPPRHGPTLYILDEPTDGLHVDDVKRLLAISSGSARTAQELVIRANLDVIPSARLRKTTSARGRGTRADGRVPAARRRRSPARKAATRGSS
jgi:excinuclease ABC subunit A